VRCDAHARDSRRRLAVHATSIEQTTDGGSSMLRRMLPSLHDRVTAQLKNIQDVADDLSRELFRAQCTPASGIHEMTAFIKAEAEAALKLLNLNR
jgi:hypothetical protein